MTTDLGEFLRTRRAAISPQDAGLTSYGARRVPGLRREELAQLAGVSPTYYTRLEQSDHHNASDEVIDALARALTLSPEEHDHLRRLARPARLSTRRGVERPRATAVAMVHAATHPAVIVDHCNDVLAWNRLGHLLLGWGTAYDQTDDVDNRPNLARMLFLAPGGRDLYADPDEAERAQVGFLRFSSGLHPHDPRLSHLIGELSQRSDAFAELWAEHPVADCGYGVKRLNHPAVGRIDLDYEAMLLNDTSHRLVLYHADAGTPAADALQLLARG